MPHSRKNILHAATSFIMLLLSLNSSPLLAAESRWHALSISAFAGGNSNGGKSKSSPDFKSHNLGSGSVISFSGSMIMEDSFDLEFTLSRMDNSSAHLSKTGDRLRSYRIKYTELSITGKKLFSYKQGRFRPWFGGGLNIGELRTNIKEQLYTPYGRLPLDGINNRDTAIGAHAACGIDIYPLKISALALSTRIHYSLYSLSDKYIDSLNGPAIYIGLRYDFLM